MASSHLDTKLDDPGIKTSGTSDHGSAVSLHYQIHDNHCESAAQLATQFDQIKIFRKLILFFQPPFSPTFCSVLSPLMKPLMNTVPPLKPTEPQLRNMVPQPQLTRSQSTPMAPQLHLMTPLPQLMRHQPMRLHPTRPLHHLIMPQPIPMDHLLLTLCRPTAHQPTNIIIVV